MSEQKRLLIIPLLFILFFIGFSPTQVAKALTFEISTRFGPPGEKVDINGTGTPENHVSVRLDGYTIASYTIDKSGNWGGTFHIPAVSSNTYTLVVMENEIEEILTTDFRVGLMIVIVTPESGPTGEGVTIMGTGFLPNTPLKYWFDEISIDETKVTEIDGTWTDVFIVPSKSLGSHEIACIETETGIELIAYYEITETTRISVNLDTVEPGMIIFIQGSNFAQVPGGPVEIYFGGDLIATLETASDGTFSTTLRVPARSDGTYKLEAIQHDYKIYASQNLQVQSYRLEASTRRTDYRSGELLDFDIWCNYPIHNAYLQIREPRGNLVWTSDLLDTIDYSISIPETALVHRVPLYDQTSRGEPLIFPDSTPTGTWSWALYEETEEIIATGTFTVSSPAPPTAVIDEPTAASYTEGEEITFRGHGIDEDGTIEAYRWTIDGDIISMEPTFSTQNLSPGTHTIDFYVWDDDGQMSTPDTIQVGIQNCVIKIESFCMTPLELVLGATAVGAGAVAVNTFATDPPTTGNVRDNLQKKELKKQRKETKEKKKEHKKKTRKIKLPFITWSITGPGKLYKRTGEININLKNIGNEAAKNITIMLNSTRGIKLDETIHKIKEIPPGNTSKIQVEFKVEPETSNGIHRVWGELITKPFYEGKKCHYIWTLKTGVISGDSPEADEIMKWLENEGYNWRKIKDTKYPYLMNYDLMILLDTNPLDQTIKNLTTFTMMGNKTIYKSTLGNNPILHKLLGVREQVHEKIKKLTSEITISKTKHPLTNMYNQEDLRNDLNKIAFSEFEIDEATLLTTLTYKAEKSESMVPLVTVNGLGNGHLVHLNMKSLDQIYVVPRIMKNTVDYLLGALFIEKKVEVLEKLRKNP